MTDNEAKLPADLGPLAWVQEELRKSLDSACKALKRFAKEASSRSGEDLMVADTTALRMVRQQLHQVTGALEMVDLGAALLLPKAMEAVVQKCVQQPEICTLDLAAGVERAGFALLEYLEMALAGKALSPLALFIPYQQMQQLAGADRCHPADLWPRPWHWHHVPQAVDVVAVSPNVQIRNAIDRALLGILQGKLKEQAAAQVKDLCAGLAAGQPDGHAQTLWSIAAAFFESLEHGLVPADSYVKRTVARVLMQYISLERDDRQVSQHLARDLLFFCAHAHTRAQSLAAASSSTGRPRLFAIVQAFELAREIGADYSQNLLGQFDPVLVAQLRKRIAALKASWAQLAEGQTDQLRAALNQLNAVAETLLNLYAPSKQLTQVLNVVAHNAGQSGQSLSPELAMEVATCLLYLEAVFDELPVQQETLKERLDVLAARLQQVQQGMQPQPLQPWIQDLYRQASDRQTMGNVVGELRTALGVVEKSLDQFFRLPLNKLVLTDVPTQLAQMRGVLSILGLDQASQAVQAMRESVQEILATEVDEERARATGTFERLGSNLGALGLLIDMLAYQPGLVRQLFSYDPVSGQLTALMAPADGWRASPHTATSASATVLTQQALEAIDQTDDAALADLSGQFDVLATQALLADQPNLAHAAQQAALAVVQHDPTQTLQALNQLGMVAAPAQLEPAQPTHADSALQEDDMQSIFVAEAREVIDRTSQVLVQLRADPVDMVLQATVRRAFHTLKGSARMVGMDEYGAAAWVIEQLLNSWLAKQQPMPESMRVLCEQALHALAAWISDIEHGCAEHWSAQAFRDSALALEQHNRLLPIASVQSDGAHKQTDPQTEKAGVGTHFYASSEPADAEQALAPSLAPPQSPHEIEQIDWSSLESLTHDSGGMPNTVTPVPVSEGASVIDFEVPLDTDDSDQERRTTDHDRVQLTQQFAQPIDRAQSLPDQHSAFAVNDAASERALGMPAVGAELADGASALTQEPPVGPSHTELVSSHPSASTHLSASSEEAVKVIGTLRVPQALYNTYLNEADEWSRRLCTELAEWVLEQDQPLPPSVVHWAHALAGASATVGFVTLSQLARALEQALGQALGQSSQGTAWAALFVSAAEHMRDMLHQFAAGFLAQEQADLLQALQSSQQPLADQAALQGAQQSHALTGLAVSGGGEYQQAAQTVLSPSVLVSDSPSLVEPAEPLASARAVPNSSAYADERSDMDQIDTDLFAVFEEEAQELLQQLGSGLRAWAQPPHNDAARNLALRHLHTFKGGARLCGAMRLGELAHRMEADIEAMSSVPSSAEFDSILAGFDALQLDFEALLANSAGSLSQQGRASLAMQQADESSNAQLPAADHRDEHTTQPAKQAAEQPATLPGTPAQAALAATAWVSNTPTVRVRTQLLEQLVNQTSEVIVSRTRLESGLGLLRGSQSDLTTNLDRLRLYLRDIELQAESQMQSRLAQSRDIDGGFDPLEFDRFTRVQELTRMMAESVNDIATVQRNLQRAVDAAEDDLVAQTRQTRQLQRDLLRTRMVEFESLSERLYRVVRQASKELGKQVKLDITGGSIEMDRGVLERMTASFEHLLRNSVAHGIEEPGVRSALGKPVAGSIGIALHQQGNDVSIDFYDDGAGLDLARIRRRAVAQGLIDAQASLSPQEAAQLIFLPGFSTAEQISELAGRGIGMDVVRSEVQALGGRIETRSEPGQGSHFTLVLPLTTAVTQVVLLRAGDLTVGIPANIVQTVRRATAQELQLAYEHGQFTFEHDVSPPFYWAGALLQSSRRSAMPMAKSTPVVVVRSAGQHVALHVDEVLGNQEVVVKNLGPQLARLPGLVGMTVLASGAVTLIYNPVALAAVYGPQAHQLSLDVSQPSEPNTGHRHAVQLAQEAHIPLVLVVDDSITVRRVTQRLLQREGYRVALAADGLQALEALQQERPVVVLADIEMPRMDGFDLLRNIRADAQLAHLPVIMITSRIAEKHRELATALKVNHYLGKPYSEEHLLSLVRHYAAASQESMQHYSSTAI